MRTRIFIAVVVSFLFLSSAAPANEETANPVNEPASGASKDELIADLKDNLESEEDIFTLIPELKRQETASFFGRASDFNGEKYGFQKMADLNYWSGLFDYWSRAPSG